MRPISAARATDNDAIARHLAEKGATKCPTATRDTIETLGRVEGKRVTRRWLAPSPRWRIAFWSSIGAARDYMRGERQDQVDAPDPIEAA